MLIENALVVASVIVNVQSKLRILACAGVPDNTVNVTKLPSSETIVRSFRGVAPPNKFPGIITLSPVEYPLPLL